jgi:MSHA biogenesis protein MshN
VREKALPTTSIANKEDMDKADNVAKQLSALSEKPVMLNSDSPAVSKLKAINQPESVVDLAQKKPVLDIVKLEDTDTKPSLTISRTQLTPQALAANKITEAEQAIERNDIIKAEALFEEVLLIMPEHETARKQLAALWYGKKSYQDAVNLLSQGIALAPQSEEMRLMTARIYYEQGQPRPAYNVLSPVKHSTSTELQALLANTAADLSEHDNAIIAYQKLIALEPHIGRWWLGSAVSLDSLGKFVPARDAYKQAIARNNLSNSAMQFARQRLIELGE